MDLCKLFGLPAIARRVVVPSPRPFTPVVQNVLRRPSRNTENLCLLHQAQALVTMEVVSRSYTAKRVSGRIWRARLRISTRVQTRHLRRPTSFDKHPACGVALPVLVNAFCALLFLSWRGLRRPRFLGRGHR
ncbi:hypothetical protein C8F01DRAFT_1237100 [Mycena amicta]|nr:hypothetical protein C8F01DRAFT_1237100 [Mycena amicta]